MAYEIEENENTHYQCGCEGFKNGNIIGLECNGEHCCMDCPESADEHFESQDDSPIGILAVKDGRVTDLFGCGALEFIISFTIEKGRDCDFILKEMCYENRTELMLAVLIASYPVRQYCPSWLELRKHTEEWLYLTNADSLKLFPRLFGA